MPIILISIQNLSVVCPYILQAKFSNTHLVTSKTFWNAYNFSFEFFFTIKNFFTNIAPRRFYNNWMWIATWLSFFPILCVLSKSANNTSSFSSSLNNFKTLSSVISIFSSFNPWIKMQFLLEYCSCLYIFSQDLQLSYWQSSEELQLLHPF